MCVSLQSDRVVMGIGLNLTLLAAGCFVLFLFVLAQRFCSLGGLQRTKFMFVARLDEPLLSTILFLVDLQLPMFTSRAWTVFPWVLALGPPDLERSSRLPSRFLVSMSMVVERKPAQLSEEASVSNSSL